MPQNMKKPLFNLGRIYSTPGAFEALMRNESTGKELFERHLSGDWGDLDDEDKQANDEAIQSGARILSAYHLADKTKIWIITDASIDANGTRLSTTLLLPDEY